MTKKEKIISILVLVFIAQIILILVFTLFSNKNITNRAMEKKILSGFKKENVVSIEINDLKDTFNVEKIENNWFVKTGSRTLPGDKSKIDSYLNILSNLTGGIIREKNSNDEIDKQYGFDKDSRQKVTVKLKNKKSYVVYVGNASKQQGYSYFKFNDNKIRETKSQIAADTSNQPVQWAKRELLENVSVEDIEKCVIDSSLPWFAGKYNLKANPEKKPDSQNIDAFVFDPKIEGKLVQYAAENIVRNLIFLRIDDYKFDADVTSRQKLATINVALKNGKTYGYFIYKSDKGDPVDYMIKVDFNNYLYLVSEASLKRVIKPREDLFEKPGKQQQ